MLNCRGFNFLDDYAEMFADDRVDIPTDKQMSALLTKFAASERNYKDAFDNLEEEKKRFIAWFYSVFDKRNMYDHYVETDTTGFLRSCIELYDPKTGSLPPPTCASDYRTDYKNA